MGQLMFAVYARLSEEDRDKKSKEADSESIQNQVSLALQFARERDWSIYDIYTDDDYGGAERSRPAWNRLLADAQAHRFDGILCKTQARFTRELELVEKYLHGLFPLWGIRFVGIADNADTDVAGNKKSRQINGLVNEWYLEDLSANIRTVFNDRRQKGLHIGSFALYGYRKDPERKGHLIIDEEAAAVVREVFALFSQGCGKTAIARMLNQRGIPNPTEYKRRQGLRYQPPKSPNATLWKYSAIADMLTNEMYIGNMVQGKYGSVSYKTKQNKPRPQSQWYVAQGTHAPIISKELWERVQSCIAQKAKPFSTGEVGVFSRKIRCASCGYFLRIHKTAKGYRYYTCTTRYVSPAACEGAFISVLKLEQAVLEQLHLLAAAYLDKNMLAESLSAENPAEAALEQVRRQIRQQKKLLEDYRRAFQSAYLDKSRGILTESECTGLLEGLRTSIDQTQNQLEQLEQRADFLLSQTIPQDENQQLLPFCTMKKLTREAVEILIDHISVGKKDAQTKCIPVTIHWNF